MMRRREMVAGLGALLAAGPGFAQAALAQTPPAPAAADTGAAPATPIAPPPAKGPPPQAPFRITLPDPKDVAGLPFDQIPNFRKQMRDIVVPLANYGRGRKPGFIVLARNAPGLLVKEQREYDWQSFKDPDGAALGKYTAIGTTDRPWLSVLDGALVDGRVVGRSSYGKATTPLEAGPLEALLGALKKEGRHSFAIEYCQAEAQMDEAARSDAKAELVGYTDDSGSYALDWLPRRAPERASVNVIRALDQVRNYLPMIGSGSFSSRREWVAALSKTNYDMLVVEPFWRGSEALTKDDMAKLRYKRMGGDRMLLASLPVGTARDTAFYWQSGWAVGNPGFLYAPNPSQDGQMLVNYWDPKWKEVLGKFMSGICDLGFDGVLFDQIDTYLYFEALNPLS